MKNHFPTDLASSETGRPVHVGDYVPTQKEWPGGGDSARWLLFGTDNAKVNIKKKLLREFNLHTIVRLPGSVFSPIPPSPPISCSFDNTHPTEETWFYRLDMPEGYKHFSKTKPMEAGAFPAGAGLVERPAGDYRGRL